MNATRLSNDPLKAPGVLGGLPAGRCRLISHSSFVLLINMILYDRDIIETSCVL